MSHRHTRERLLARFAALAAAEQAERDAHAAVLQAALDAICELQAAWLHAASRTSPRDVVVAAWAAQTLGLELTPGEPIPAAVRDAFGRAQDALWAGQAVPDVEALLGDAEPDQLLLMQVERVADWA